MLYVASIAVVAVASCRTGYRRPSTPDKHAISSSEQKIEPPIPSVMLACPRTRPAGTQPALKPPPRKGNESASRGGEVVDELNGPSYHCFRRRTRITSGPTEIFRPPSQLFSTRGQNLEKQNGPEKYESGIVYQRVPT